MGKNLIQQRRGRGTARFRARSFRYAGTVCYPSDKAFEGKVTDIVHSAGHSSPVASVLSSEKKDILMFAPHGLSVGDSVQAGENVEIKAGNVLPLKNIPTGTSIYNLESTPGDGGKFVRASGTSAKVMVKSDGSVTVMLPSKRMHDFNPKCRATIGMIAGSGRIEKPLYKAGRKYHKMRARNKLYPHVCALSMNAVAHPFGGSRSSKKGKPMIARRNAPPGAKVGLIRPSRTGKKR